MARRNSPRAEHRGARGSLEGKVVETTYQRVTNLLRTEILTGKIPLGGWLRMTATAERFGVSVQPVREALQQLEGEGFLEMIPNRGARVRLLDRSRLIHAHEIGMGLEAFFARQFAEEASLSSLRKIEAIQARHDAAIEDLDWPRIDAVNHAFHWFINTHGGNLEAGELITRYYGLSEGIMNRQGRDLAFAQRVRTEHHQMLDCFRSRDPDGAARVAAQHVEGTLSWVLEAFEAALAR